MKFFSKGASWSKQGETPEGFLICYDVPIARLGEMIYGANEVPVDAGRDGLIRVTRDDDSLFNPTTIASFEGKPVVNDHPEEDVTPANWRKYAVGTVQNVRRGEGALKDCLLADLVVTEAQAIRDVKDGKREVSCGYDADYEQLGPGRGQQHNIIGNHVALVDKGRCGPRCAIGDSEMAKRKVSLRDRIRAAFKARDAEELENAMADAELDLGEVHDEDTVGEKGDTHVHVHLNNGPMGEKVEDEGEMENSPDDELLVQRVEAIEQTLADLAEAVARLANAEEDEGEDDGEDVLGEDAEVEGEGRSERREEGEGGEVLGEDEEYEEGEDVADRRARDKGRDHAMTLSGEARKAFANAEALVPGIRFPATDSKNPRKTRDTLCRFRKDALKKAYLAGGVGRDAIASVLGGRKLNLKTATCDAVSTVFNGAAEIAKRGNVQVMRKSLDRNAGLGPKSIEEINEQNRKFWAGK